MPFSDEPRTYTESRTRTSGNYFKFSPDYRSVGRVLNAKAVTIWKHWLPQANGGKGFAVVCANTSSQVRPCPVDKLADALPENDEKRKDYYARRRFVVNILDRTPHTVCDACGNTTPGKKCVVCKNDVSKNEFEPLNQVKILEGGPELFNKTLNPIAQMYEEDHGVDITAYDIVFMTQGVGRDRKIAANPLKIEELPEEAFLDENGAPQALFNLDDLAEATSVAAIEMYLAGATIKEVNEAEGVGALPF